MDIDIYKIPAFQRQKTVKITKGSSFKVESSPDIREKIRLRKENAAALRKNKSITIKMPPPLLGGEDDFDAPFSAPPKKQVAPSWRKMSCIGTITHYFEQINVIALELLKPIKTGDRIIIESPNGLFEQELSSMQINRQDVKNARKGDDVGIKVQFEPKLCGSVYKVVAEG